MEKLKNQHPDIYEEYTSTTEKQDFPELKRRLHMLQKKGIYLFLRLSSPRIQRECSIIWNWQNTYLMQMKRLYHCRTFASHAHLPLMLDDRIPEERETAMQIGALMLDLCEVLIICGSCISEGMRREIQTAFEKGKAFIGMIPR